MTNNYFQFRQFKVLQEKSAMKVTTDACLFGAWTANQIQKSKVKIQKVLDVGAGSGLLSLMVAQKSAATITAVEIDARAAEEAAENFKTSPWSNRIKAQQGDVLQLDVPKDFDAIVCNPPFYHLDLKGPDAGRNTAHHSSQLQMERLVPFLKDHISEEGIIYLLLPYRRKKEMETLFSSNGLYLHRAVVVAPVHRLTRWMVSLRKNKPQEIEHDSLLIRNWDGYSTEFKNLLQDYYLHL